jgi:DNA topoisomerase-2
MIIYIEKKKKIKVTPSSIKSQLILFIKCDIVNPAFDSQSKDFMNTDSNKFGSKCVICDKVIEKLAKMGIMEQSCAITEIKTANAIEAKTTKPKKKNIRIDKLVDANWAGTNKSDKCMFILTEGDAAKAGLMSGLTAEHRDYIGIFALKGKVLNVRDEALSRIMANTEIANIIEALGLSTSKKYETVEDVTRDLRYGCIAAATDQDLDGSHIKGLLINLFDSRWGSLLKILGFFRYINTPILKAHKGNEELEFYNAGEYTKWQTHPDTRFSQWTIKYYKGLGTSTSKEWKKYFKNLKTISFEHTGEKCSELIDMAFRKSRTSDRKLWIGKGNNGQPEYLETNTDTVTYGDFINKELVHFSIHDCERSIHSLVDGFKPGHRKIVHACFKRNLKSDIKVAILSGYVSEHAHYHHGETSLQKTIIGMGQTFVGSTNVNLLVPSGQFGTRLEGGEDSASPRYIFTRLEEITRYLFPKADDAVLEYLEDEGDSIEPKYFVPIVCMAAINENNGIGTGFSTGTLGYTMVDNIDYLERKIALEDGENESNVKPTPEFIPYYEGFKGTVKSLGKGKYQFKGVYEKVGNNAVRITELPVGVWTTQYKTTVLYCLEDPEAFEKDKEKKKNTKLKGKDDKKIKKIQLVPQIKSFTDNCSDSHVNFLIQFAPGKIEELEAKIDVATGCNGIEQLLRLTSTKSTTNMHLFNAENELIKYETVTDIIDAFYPIRYELYVKRKNWIIQQMEKEIIVLSAKEKFIRELLDDTITMHKKSKDEVNVILFQGGYPQIDKDGEQKNPDNGGSYKYLTEMPMSRVFVENADKMFAECTNKQTELATVKATSIRETWCSELNELRIQHELFVQRRIDNMGEAEESPNLIDTKTKKNKKISKTKPKPKPLQN